MAQPILLHLPPRDPREALYERLQNAPQEHVEALLDLYAIMQGLHDRGLLELAKGALGSGDKVLKILVDAADSPEVIRGIRNAMILAKIADKIDPKLLESIERAVPQGLAEAAKEKPPGLFSVLRKLLSSDTRRVLVATASILESVGKSLRSDKSA